MLSTQTGVRFRALLRIFAHHGIEKRGNSDAFVVAHALHPEWAANTSAKLKITTSARRPEVRRKMSEAKIKAFRADPSLHPNAHVTMSTTETMLAAILESAGVAFRFSVNADRYWLDFLLPELGIGVELQRCCHPCQKRDATIRQTLGLKAILYLPTRYFREGKAARLEHLVADLKAGSLDPSSLGEYAMISCQAKRGTTISLNGHHFLRPWIPV
jgi:hypothetical protein